MGDASSASEKSSDRGLGLVEVVIAVVLLGILSSAVIAIVLQGQASTVNNRSRVAASNLAAREIDYVREEFMASNEGPLDLMGEGTTTNPHSFGSPGSALTVDGKSYTVTRSVAWNVLGSEASACEGGALVEYPTMNVRVEVTWPNMGSTKPVVNTTNLAPPKGVGLSTVTSYVAVKVRTANGDANPGRHVTVFAQPGESRTGITDEYGCAVVEVNPAGGSGTSYSVRLSDPGHVDISGVTDPVRTVGLLTRGTLNSSVDMSYDRAATLTVTVTGGGVVDSDVIGSPIGIYQSQFSGGDPISIHNLTGTSTTITGLWPTEYGAFFGSTPPNSYPVVVVPPGGSESIEVPISLAEYTMTDAPSDTDIIAVPQGGTSCTSPGARVVDPQTGGLIPGPWSFFAESDEYGCSDGPVEIELAVGPGNEIEWEPTSLKIQDAPTDLGPVWAVSSASANASCTVPNPVSAAVRLGDGPDATAELLAGDWYVFVTEEDGGSPASGADCESTGLVSVPYGQDTTFTWDGS